MRNNEQPMNTTAQHPGTTSPATKPPADFTFLKCAGTLKANNPLHRLMAALGNSRFKDAVESRDADAMKRLLEDTSWKFRRVIDIDLKPGGPIHRMARQARRDKKRMAILEYLFEELSPLSDRFEWGLRQDILRAARRGDADVKTDKGWDQMIRLWDQPLAWCSM